MRAVLFAVAALVAVIALVSATGKRDELYKEPWSASFDFGLQSVARALCGDETEHCLDVLALASTSNTGARKKIVQRVLNIAADAVRHAPLLSQKYGDRLPPFVSQFFTMVHKRVAGRDLSDYDIAVEFSALRRQGALRSLSGDTAGADQYPYFGFLPRLIGSAVPGAAAFTAPTECFTNVSMSSEWIDNVTLTATLVTAGQTSFMCTDVYAIGLMDAGVKLASITWPGTTTYTLKINASDLTDARKWYIQSRGLRLFKFNKSVLGLIGDVIDTAVLLAGFFESNVPNATMVANYEFLRDYVEISPRMQPMSRTRTAGMNVVNELNESYIQSGDGLVVVRYDGLDPIIGWGEGFTGGHSVIAIRHPTTNVLHVCESTAHDGYWQTNGIQCHPWKLWFTLAQKASYNVLLAPLAPKYAAKFNATAAWAFFEETQGLNYGYLNFLFGWIDTKNKNFPCLPPTYNYCLNEALVETIAMLWDRFQPTSPTNVFRQALNHRIGTVDLSVTEVMQYGATKQNLTFQDIYTIAESDSWVYNTTRFGKPAVGRSMVCCVFVCHMWKQGGLFGEINDQINCGEQTLWDIFSMNIFDAQKLGDGRPAVCKNADPSNQLCQLIGGHTFYAKPDFNTRLLYPWMGQKCSSECPDYIREPQC